ncbi:MAG: response regulator [Nitrospiraceae bacterium]|nr:response regulator [Nitrospiraceae bacterium]
MTSQIRKYRKHILLVDDREYLLQSMAEGLEAVDGDFEIHTAGNGRKALEILKASHKIDLLVTDLEMPVMDGFELLAVVKQEFPALPAIIITGHITPKIKERIKAIGDYLCIEKPIGFKELRRRIIDELRIHSKPEEKRPK